MSLEGVDDPEIAAMASRYTQRPSVRAYPLAAVDIVDHLHRMPIFAFASIDELFRIAQSARQVVLRPGQRPYRRGDTVREVVWLLEGRVAIACNPSAQEVTAPAALTLFDALAGRRVRHTITVIEPAVCLAVHLDQFLTMLSENVALTQGLFSAMLGGEALRRPPPVHPARDGAEPLVVGRETLQPMDKVVALEQSPLIGEGSLDDLFALAGVARETSLIPGVLFRERDAAAVYSVVSGEIRLERDGCETIDVRAGATIGMYETLAGGTMGWRATVAAKGLALRIEREALFDVLADRVEMLRSVFRALSGTLRLSDSRVHALRPSAAETGDRLIVAVEALDHGQQLRHIQQIAEPSIA
jgi:CRP-like cAMP-binding protein